MTTSLLPHPDFAVRPGPVVLCILDGVGLVEVPSDRLPYDERPWMKAAEIADAVVQHEARTSGGP